MSPTLQAAMARALYGESDSHLESARLAAERILRSLHADPEVLTAMAEALYTWYAPTGELAGVRHDHVWDQCRQEAARLLDALLGAGSAAEGADRG